jgi:hypothetical protein
MNLAAIIDAVCDYQAKNNKFPTHLYIEAQEFMELVEAAIAKRQFIDPESILGMRVVITKMPENAPGRFFVTT